MKADGLLALGIASPEVEDASRRAPAHREQCHQENAASAWLPIKGSHRTNYRLPRGTTVVDCSQLENDPGVRVSRIAPWVVASVTVIAFAFTVVLDERAGSYGSAAWELLAWSVAGFSSTGVGLLLATRRRGNPIGWLLLLNGAVIVTLGLSESYADYAILAHPDALPGASWGVLLSQRAWPLLFAAITAIAWVFPDGRLPSPRWRPYAIAGAVSYALLVVLSFLATERFEEPFVGQPSPLPELPESVVAIPIALTGLGALASSSVGRWRCGPD